MRAENLSPESIRSYLQFHYPQESEAFFDKESAAMLERFTTGQRDYQNYVVVYNDKQPVWSFMIFADGDDNYGIVTPRALHDLDISAESWKASAQLLKNRLTALKAKSAILRFTEGQISKNLSHALGSIGFKKHSDRIEYKTMVADLPDEAGTPFTWKAIGTEGLDVQFAADMMSRCIQGDPYVDSSFNALESIKGDLADDSLYGQLDAIHIGYLNNKPVAFVFAQTDVKSKWARLTFLGLDPDLRGQGLGVWVHRHGFAMLRAQGGVEYHGGTIAANKGMMKTFAKNNCKELRRMQEWNFRQEM